jgi:hypothetical protein
MVAAGARLGLSAKKAPTQVNTDGEWSRWSGARYGVGGRPSDMMWMLHPVAVMPNMGSKWEEEAWQVCPGAKRKEADRWAPRQIKSRN